MSRISLSMIVKNEEKYLAECLESVKNVVDDIVIVDTGSEDNTVEIAKLFDASVFEYKWNDDFSEARNFALSKTDSDWVLYLDADERLEKSSIETIKKLTAKNSNIGFRCKIYNIDEINNKPKIQSSTRLFKNTSGIEFRGKAHEQIDDSLISNGYQIINSEILINHIGYNIDRKGLQEKAARNLKLMLEDYQINPSGYYAFQIANSYSLLDNKEKAFQFYEFSLSDSNLPNEYQSLSLSNMAEYYLRINNIDHAVATVNKAIKCDPVNIISNLTASEIYFKAGKGEEAVSYCKKALTHNETGTSKKEHRLLEVFLDNEKIIYHGLNVAYGTNQREGIDYFFGKLEQFKSSAAVSWRKELNLIQLVSMDNPLSPEEINDTLSVINDNNLDFYLSLFKNYQHSDVKLQVDEKLLTKFPQNIVVRNKYAYNLNKAGKPEKAITVFEETVNEFPDDVTPIFYLISLYLEQQELSKLEKIISESKERHSGNKAFLSHLNDFENKINSYLLNTN